MEDSIKELIIKYGPQEVHKCVDRVCRELYEELTVLYGQAQFQLQRNQVEEIPSQNVLVPIEEPPKQDENLPSQPLVKEIVLPKRIIKKKNVVVEEQHIPEPQTVAPTNEPQTESSLEPPKNPRKEMKDNHRAAVRIKYDELVAKGIEPLTLLTKDNLEKWLKSGLSYQRIARDHVGLHEATISRIAHEQGLESQVKRHEILKWLNKK